MKSSCTVFALLWIQLLPSVHGQTQKIPCYCEGPGSARGCNFFTLYCSRRDNNCRKENVALGKRTNYSTLFRLEEYETNQTSIQGCMAANGFISTEYFSPNMSMENLNCYHSGDWDTGPFWQVDLGKIYLITEITIYGRTGFLWRMVNTIVAIDDFVCYRFPTGNTDSVLLRTDIELSPPVKGLQVLVYKHKSPPPDKSIPLDKHSYHLNICEVQVWVCKLGYYGKDCTGVCSGKCINCDNYDGTCHGGNIYIYTCTTCKCCKNGYYGAYCDTKCGQCEGNCLQINGTCTSGICQKGWTGVKCDEACKLGHYGANCKEICGTCAGGTACSRLDGVCTSGCDPGFKGPLCNIPCSDREWGPNCNSSCVNCYGDTCYFVDGECLKGCKAGWQPNRCTTPCKAGTYGFNCNSACGNCKKGTSCDIITGACPAGCDDGWMSAGCNEPCSYIHYGPGCNNTCGKCRGGIACNPSSGECPQDCQDGYLTLFCNESCPNGTFGKNCSSECSPNCENNICHTENGVCKLGCVSGFKGAHCKDKEILEEGIKSGTNDNYFIAGILAIAAVISAILILIACRRKKKNEEKELLQTSKPQEHTGSQSLPPVNQTAEEIFEKKSSRDSTGRLKSIGSKKSSRDSSGRLKSIGSKKSSIQDQNVQSEDETKREYDDDYDDEEYEEEEDEEDES